VHEHLEQRLAANAFPVCDFASPLEIRSRQADRNLNAALSTQLRNQA
jgi:hypothetical protein